MSEQLTSAEPLIIGFDAAQESGAESTPIDTGPPRPEPKGGLNLVLPVLPARGTVLYPRLPLPVSIGRKRSIEAIQAAVASEDKTIVVVAQRDAALDEPGRNDLFQVGTLAVVKHMMRTSEGIRVLLVGIGRVAVEALEQEDPYRRARVSTLPPPSDEGPEVEAHRRVLVDLSRRALEILQPEGSGELSRLLDQTSDALQLAYMMAHLLPLDLPRAQAILEAGKRIDALRILEEYLREEIQVPRSARRSAARPPTR
jgi:ATP-dependent Lon protease